MKESSQKSKIIRIGNSQGIRLAKHMLQTSNIHGEVEIFSEPGKITITPVVKERPRSGWAGQIAVEMQKGGDDDFQEWEAVLVDGLDELYES